MQIEPVLRERVLMQLYADSTRNVPSTQRHVANDLNVPIAMISRALKQQEKAGRVSRGELVGPGGTRGARRYLLTDEGRKRVRELLQGAGP